MISNKIITILSLCLHEDSCYNIIFFKFGLGLNKVILHGIRTIHYVSEIQ